MTFDRQQLQIPDYVEEERQRCRDTSGRGMYETGLIVDGNNVMYRLAFAASKDISDECDMLKIFEERIKSVVKEINAEMVVCAIDAGVSLRRSMLGAQKKSDKTPEQQAVIDIARAALHLLQAGQGELGLNPIWMDGYEADDIAAAFAVSGLCIHTVIYSTDSDLYQMTNGSGVTQLSPANGNFLVSEIPQSLVPGVKALAGDSSDNVVGIKGIGPKTAMKVITGEKTIYLSKEDTRRVLHNLTLTALPFPGSFQCLVDMPPPLPKKYFVDDYYVGGEPEEEELPF